MGGTEFFKVDTKAIHDMVYLGEAVYSPDTCLLATFNDPESVKELDKLIYYVGGEREGEVIGYVEGEFLIVRFEDNERFGRYLIMESDDE